MQQKRPQFSKRTEERSPQRPIPARRQNQKLLRLLATRKELFSHYSIYWCQRLLLQRWSDVRSICKRYCRRLERPCQRIERSSRNLRPRPSTATRQTKQNKGRQQAPSRTHQIICPEVQRVGHYLCKKVVSSGDEIHLTEDGLKNLKRLIKTEILKKSSLL